MISIPLSEYYLNYRTSFDRSSKISENDNFIIKISENKSLNYETRFSRILHLLFLKIFFNTNYLINTKNEGYVEKDT